MLGAIVGDIVGSIYEFDVTCQGSVPQAKWGVPDDIAEAALGRLDGTMTDVFRTFMNEHAK